MPEVARLVVVDALLTVCPEGKLPLLAVKPALATKRAATECDPGASVDVLSVATPLTSADAGRSTLSTLKMTLPVGTRSGAATVAVMLADCPNTTEFAGVAKVVVVGEGPGVQVTLTVMVRGLRPAVTSATLTTTPIGKSAPMVALKYWVVPVVPVTTVETEMLVRIRSITTPALGALLVWVRNSWSPG